MSKEISLTQGKTALVDDEDFENLNQWKWQAVKCANGFYAAHSVYLGGGRRNARYERVWMHREISHLPDSMEIDHKDHNGLNNQRVNLRICTHGQNSRNRKPKKIGQWTSRFKGVCWASEQLKWRVYITVSRRRIHLGYFISEIKAAQAYDRAALKYYGEFACLNFPGA